MLTTAGKSRDLQSTVYTPERASLLAASAGGPRLVEGTRERSETHSVVGHRS